MRLCSGCRNSPCGRSRSGMTKPEPHPVALLVLGLRLITAACEHTMPPEYHPPEAQPPRSDELPRQLTFTPVSADRSPSITAGVLAYSRLAPDKIFYRESF